MAYYTPLSQYNPNQPSYWAAKPSGSTFIGPTKPSSLAQYNPSSPTYWAAPKPAGQVAGISDTASVGSGGRTGGSLPSGQPSGDTGQPAGPSAEDLFNSQKQDFYNSLDSQLQTATTQKSTQEASINDIYGKNVADLNQQQALQESQLQSRKTANLNDLADNLQNLWQQGNQRLGVSGASDSSAAGQMAYAITKLGSKQRTDILNNYDTVWGNLKSVFQTNKTALDNQFAQQMSDLNSWYSQVVAGLASQKGQFAQIQSQKALDMALSEVQRIANSYDTQKSMLQQWALNRAQTVTQYHTLMGQVGQSLPKYQDVGSIFGQVTKQPLPTMTGFGNTANQQYDQYGNPINQ